MNYFKEAEHILRNRVKLERAISNLEQRQKRIVDNASPQELKAIDFSKPYTDSHFVSDTYGELFELSAISSDIQKTLTKISEIDAPFLTLDIEEQKLIELWYFKNKTKEEILEILNLNSPAALYERRNRAINAFAILYFGAGALSFM